MTCRGRRATCRDLLWPPYAAMPAWPTPCRRALLTACSDRVGPYSAHARSLWELGSHPAARLMQQRGHLAPLIILAKFRQAERRVPAAQNSRSSSGHEWAPRPSAMACGMARGERQCTAADAESKIKAKAKKKSSTNQQRVKQVTTASRSPPRSYPLPSFAPNPAPKRSTSAARNRRPQNRPSTPDRQPAKTAKKRPSAAARKP